MTASAFGFDVMAALAATLPSLAPSLAKQRLVRRPKWRPSGRLVCLPAPASVPQTGCHPQELAPLLACMCRSHPDRAVREEQLNFLLTLASHPDDCDRYAARGMGRLDWRRPSHNKDSPASTGLGAPHTAPSWRRRWWSWPRRSRGTSWRRRSCPPLSGVRPAPTSTPACSRPPSSALSRPSFR